MEDDPKTAAAAESTSANGEAEPQNNAVHKDALLQRSRLEMDTACDLLAESHQKMNKRCNEFEALLDVPGQTLAVIRKASAEVRAAGMLSMGLTTKYLTALNDYLKTKQ